METQDKMVEVLSELKEFTREGEYQDALSLLMDYFRKNSHPKILAETVRLSLLLDKKEQALKLFFHLNKNENRTEFIDANILLRLKLCFPDDAVVQDCELVPAMGGKWVDDFIKNKNEKIYEANLINWYLKCGDGRSYYKFNSKCRSCDHEHLVPVYMFFLIYREYLCPNCLAKQFLNFDVLESFFRADKIDDKLADKIEACDEKCRQIRVNLNNDTLVDNQYPLMSQYLNIDYVFILNQLIVKRLYNQS